MQRKHFMGGPAHPSVLLLVRLLLFVVAARLVLGALLRKPRASEADWRPGRNRKTQRISIRGGNSH